MGFPADVNTIGTLFLIITSICSSINGYNSGKLTAKLNSVLAFDRKKTVTAIINHLLKKCHMSKDDLYNGVVEKCEVKNKWGKKKGYKLRGKCENASSEKKMKIKCVII